MESRTTLRRAQLGAVLAGAVFLFALSGHAAPEIVPGTVVGLSAPGAAASLTLPAVGVPALPAPALLGVCVGTERGSTNPSVATAVTWNARALTAVGADQSTGSGRTQRAELWLLDAADLAVTSDVLITLDSTADRPQAIAFVVSGAEGVEAIGTSAGDATGTSVLTETTTLTEGGFLVDCLNLGQGMTGNVTEMGQTKQAQLSEAAQVTYLSDRPAGPVGANAMGWSWPNASRIAHVVAAFEATVAPPPMCQEAVFLPGDVDYLDVADFGAVPDDGLDDAPAFQAAIDASNANAPLGKRIVYAGEGTFRLCSQVAWRDAAGVWLQNLSLLGAGRTKTLLQLCDDAPGFDSRVAPRGVLYTASKVECGAPSCGENAEWLENGSGNKAFHIHVSNLSLDLGQGNPGAVGIDYIASNVGSIRDVAIRCPGVGHAGIGATREGPGPLLIQDVEIEGCDYGLDVAHLNYSVTVENVRLTNQRNAGIRNASNSLAIRSLRSLSPVPAVYNTNADGLVVLVDSQLEGCSGLPAVRNDGKLLARGVTAPGYATVLPGVASPVTEYTSHGPYHAFAADAGTTLGLEVEETPVEVWSDDPNAMANLADYGVDLTGATDSRAEVQAAMDSGKPIVYSPGGFLRLSGPVTIPPSVRMVHGFGTAIQPTAGTYGNPLTASDVFVVTGEGGTLTLKRFWAALFQSANVVRQSSQRRVVVKDVGFGTVGAIHSDPNAGDVFLEDVGGGVVRVEAGSSLWGRQVNPENRGSGALGGVHVQNAGRAWLLGLKTEAPKPVVRTLAGGCTEVLGGLAYPVTFVGTVLPVFEVQDGGRGSFALAETSFSAGAYYTPWIRETRGGQTLEVTRSQLPVRGGGRVLPLGSAHNAPCP